MRDDIPVIDVTPPRRWWATRRARRLFMVAALLAGLLSANALITVWFIQSHQMQTVSFDMKGTVDRFTEQAAAQNLSEAASSALTARFMSALAGVLDQYQQRHSVVILVAPAVVGGAPDITADIQQQIAERMSAR